MIAFFKICGILYVETKNLYTKCGRLRRKMEVLMMAKKKLNTTSEISDTEHETNTFLMELIREILNKLGNSITQDAFYYMIFPKDAFPTLRETSRRNYIEGGGSKKKIIEYIIDNEEKLIDFYKNNSKFSDIIKGMNAINISETSNTTGIILKKNPITKLDLCLVSILSAIILAYNEQRADIESVKFDGSKMKFITFTGISTDEAVVAQTKKALSFFNHLYDEINSPDRDNAYLFYIFIRYAYAQDFHKRNTWEDEMKERLEKIGLKEEEVYRYVCDVLLKSGASGDRGTEQIMNLANRTQSVLATYDLGECFYYNTNGCCGKKPDFLKAFQTYQKIWSEKDSENQYPLAGWSLAYMYINEEKKNYGIGLDGMSISERYEKAIFNFKIAAKKGCGAAFTSLGNLCTKTYVYPNNTVTSSDANKLIFAQSVWHNLRYDKYEEVDYNYIFLPNMELFKLFTIIAPKDFEIYNSGEKIDLNTFYKQLQSESLSEFEIRILCNQNNDLNKNAKKCIADFLVTGCYDNVEYSHNWICIKGIPVTDKNGDNILRKLKKLYYKNANREGDVNGTNNLSCMLRDDLMHLVKIDEDKEKIKIKSAFEGLSFLSFEATSDEFAKQFIENLCETVEYNKNTIRECFKMLDVMNFAIGQNNYGLHLLGEHALEKTKYRLYEQSDEDKRIGKDALERSSLHSGSRAFSWGKLNYAVHVLKNTDKNKTKDLLSQLLKLEDLDKNCKQLAYTELWAVTKELGRYDDFKTAKNDIETIVGREIMEYNKDTPNSVFSFVYKYFKLLIEYNHMIEYKHTSLEILDEYKDKFIDMINAGNIRLGIDFFTLQCEQAKRINDWTPFNSMYLDSVITFSEKVANEGTQSQKDDCLRRILFAILMQIKGDSKEDTIINLIEKLKPSKER